jgi:hypothetical protein
MEWNGLMQQRVPWIKPEVMWPLVILYTGCAKIKKIIPVPKG